MTSELRETEKLDDDEPNVRLVTVGLCELCIGGAGGECHTPGCILWLNRAPDLALHAELIEDASATTAELARIRAMALKHLVGGEEVNATTEALVSQLCSITDDEALQRDIVKAAVALRKDKAPGCPDGIGCCKYCALLHAVDEYLREKA